MEPKMEQPKKYTPEEMAQLEKSRTASDKALGDGGAEYKFNEKGEKENLLVTEKQKDFLEKTRLYTEVQQKERVLDLINKAKEKAKNRVRQNDKYKNLPEFQIIDRIERQEFFLEIVNGEKILITHPKINEKKKMLQVTVLGPIQGERNFRLEEVLDVD